jgi:hypothetical protein
VSVLFFSLVSVIVPWVNAQSDEGPSEVAEAEDALVLGYEAVLEAEERGANVSSLLARLSGAGEYLAQAYAWSNLGDFDRAGNLAGFCIEVVDDVEREAVLLRDEAARMEREGLLVRVFGSAIGVVIVLVSSFLLWIFFKRRYEDRVLRARPEVKGQ